MILNAMEKRLLFQVEGDCLAKVLNELHMVARYTKSPEQGDAAESLMAKLRPLTDAEAWIWCGTFRRITVCPIRPGRLGKRLRRPGSSPARRN